MVIGFQGVSEVFTRSLGDFKRISKEFQGVFKHLKAFQWVSENFRGIQGVSGDFPEFQGVFKVVCCLFI